MKTRTTMHSNQPGSSEGNQQRVGRRFGFSVAILLSAVALATPAFGNFERLQNNAEEVLRIRVIRVDADADETVDWCSYTVQARVLSVFRSKSGLQRGDVIEFNNFVTSRHAKKNGCRCCAASPPLVMKFWTGRVYLDAATNVNQVSHTSGTKQLFTIAARGDSLKSGPLSGVAFSRQSPTRKHIRFRLPSQ